MFETTNKPIVFLAFANDRDDTVGYLRNLADETRRLRDVLEPAKQAGLCEVVVRQNSTAGDIFKVFQDPEYRNRIAAYMLAMEVSFARYLELYRKQPLTMLEKRGPVTGKYPKSVATTWAVNYQQLADAQRDVLCLSAYLAPERIPLELFAAGRSELGEAIGEAIVDADLVPELLEPLHRVSLIRRDSVDKSYSVHRLVQEVTKDALDAELSRTWVERAVRAINRTFPHVELASWPLCERLVPHALLASRMIAEHDLASDQSARLLNQSGFYLKQRGQYSFALSLHKQALEIKRKVLGEEHPDFATSCNNLAALYKSTGRDEEAEPLYKQAVEILRAAFGQDHPSTKTVSDNYERFLRERSVGD